MTNATQDCAAARGHSEDAVNNISSAGDTVQEQITQLNGILNDLGTTISLIEGTRQDSIQLAANHMHQVQENVGSTTAGEIAQGYMHAHDQLGGEPIGGINMAMQNVKDAITALQSAIHAMNSTQSVLVDLKDRVDTLAAQLGA